MPRNGSGVYTLPAGNPVAPNTLIEADWANSTLADVAAELTASLARAGTGGMTGPLRVPDGSVTSPSLSFNLETATGIYRAGAGQVAIATAGVQRFIISSAGLTVAVPLAVTGNATITGNVLPEADGTRTVGSSTAHYSQVFTNAVQRFSAGILTINAADAGGSIALRVAGNTYVTIGSAGNVVVAAPSSGTAVTINGAVNSSPLVVAAAAGAAPFVANQNEAAFRYISYNNSNAAGAGGFAFSVGTGGTLVSGHFYGNAGVGGAVGVSSNHPFAIRTNNIDRALFNAAGGLVIVAPTSGDPLAVRWAGNDGATVGGTATNVRSAIHVGSTADSVGTVFYYERSSGKSGFGQAANPSAAITDVLTWDANRAVTIGTAASGRPLTVRNIAGQLNLTLIGRSADGGAGFAFRDGSDSAETAAIIALGTNALTFWTGTVQRVTVDAIGRVTIAAPSSAGVSLEVNASQTRALNITRASAAAVEFALVSTGFTTWSFLNDLGNGLKIQQDGTTKLRIGSGGNAFITPQGDSEFEIGFRRVPAVSTAGATAGLNDRGKCFDATGNITINDAVFAAGDCLSVYNNSASAISLVAGSGVTMRLAGTTTTGTRSLGARGLATLWFRAANEVIVSGAGVT